MSSGEGLRMILWQSLSPIFGSLFHPSYMMVNVKLLGQIKEPLKADCTEQEKDDLVECMTGTKLQAAFGMGSATVAIFLLASSLCFVLGLNTVIS